MRPLIENKSSIVLAPASSAYKHSLKEVLANPAIASKIKNTKVGEQGAAAYACPCCVASEGTYQLLLQDATCM
jgi:hypothetical protein